MDTQENCFFRSRIVLIYTPTAACFATVTTEFLTASHSEGLNSGCTAGGNTAPGGLERRDGMPTGTVKWFNSTKGYGFIAPDDGGKDVFVHISAVERAGLKGLNDNQKIAYELQSGRDGRASASDLTLL
jgi:CspA family cold shock protein